MLGIGVRVERETQEAIAFDLAKQVAEYLELPGAVSRADVTANCDYRSSGYGVPIKGTLEAVKLVARLEGILLDPVCSGKGMAGLIDLIRRGHILVGMRMLSSSTRAEMQHFSAIQTLSPSPTG